MSDPRYPIGKFTYDGPPNETQRERFIVEIEHAPAALRLAIHGLTAPQLDTPYREGGWKVRQVVHHLPDSHMNGYVRFKLALTEQQPTIKPYSENLWAELQDSVSTPVEVSLALLENLHVRWAKLLRSMRADDWKRTLNHPELGTVALEKYLSMYAWHGRHHVAHITTLRTTRGW